MFGAIVMVMQIAGLVVAFMVMATIIARNWNQDRTVSYAYAAGLLICVVFAVFAWLAATHGQLR